MQFDRCWAALGLGRMLSQLLSAIALAAGIDDAFVRSIFEFQATCTSASPPVYHCLHTSNKQYLNTLVHWGLLGQRQLCRMLRYAERSPFFHSRPVLLQSDILTDAAPGASADPPAACVRPTLSLELPAKLAFAASGGPDSLQTGFLAPKTASWRPRGLLVC